MSGTSVTSTVMELPSGTMVVVRWTGGPEITAEDSAGTGGGCIASSRGVGVADERGGMIIWTPTVWLDDAAIAHGAVP